MTTPHLELALRLAHAAVELRRPIGERGRRRLRAMLCEASGELMATNAAPPVPTPAPTPTNPLVMVEAAIAAARAAGESNIDIVATVNDALESAVAPQ
ncbi:MAG TPA: hypothetical protein VD995_03165 [Azospirillum sp.]|nr:hypothetical protein [Azospirillum sp.]